MLLMLEMWNRLAVYFYYFTYMSVSCEMGKEKSDVTSKSIKFLSFFLADPNSSSLTECRASFVQCASDITRKMTSSESTDKLRASSLAQLAFRCQGNTTNTTVTNLTGMTQNAAMTLPRGQKVYFIRNPWVPDTM